MLKILIPVDGSDPADRAIDTVARLAREGLQLQVRLLNVRELPLYYGELPALNVGEIEAALVQQQHRVLEEARARAERLGLAVVGLDRAVGAAGPEIVRVATEHAVDQVVMGTHGRGALGQFFLGSVAQRVLHGWSGPLLLVR
jgi:nucleotide-binding universal stress UspA family protein